MPIYLSAFKPIIRHFFLIFDSMSIPASVQLSSVQSLSHVQLCDPMNCSTSGLPVHHQLPEFTQTHVHPVGDACLGLLYIRPYVIIFSRTLVCIAEFLATQLTPNLTRGLFQMSKAFLDRGPYTITY